MNSIHFFIILIIVSCVSASNPTYWISKTGDRRITTTTKPKPIYDPSTSDAQTIVDCNFYRSWECALESDLSPEQAFCKRLATDQPNESEKDQDKFAALRDDWVRVTGTDVYVESTSCYKPTYEEKQIIENCFFSRSWRQKEASKLTSLDSFCMNLAADKPSAMDTTELNQLLAYRKVWVTMPDVGRQDYAQLLECSAVENYYGPYPELLSSDCFRFFELLRKPKTFRDLRRVQMHACLNPDRLKGIQRSRCVCILHTYRQLFYQDDK